MTRLLAWCNEWSLGIDALDEDHRALVEALTDISLRYCPQASALVRGARATAGVSGAGAPVSLVEALSGFGEKLRVHCRREDAFLRAIEYTEREQHETQHVALMATFDSLVQDYRGRAIQVFDAVGQELVRDWLLGHIVSDDRDFAQVYFALCGLDGADATPRQAPGYATRDAASRRSGPGYAASYQGAQRNSGNASRAIAIGIAMPKPW
ncbi:hemerythrin domain-containing protein [uncultured Thiodictyon sp.]|uniref:bacteriohemerythrin n=1 Tax=uncultured Thiodictyon sp. TaxID=1846217 RepID=UPI0025CC4265|nr:hemerythrin domain-containing protein [uncultured Thiodictyon sp.]